MVAVGSIQIGDQWHAAASGQVMIPSYNASALEYFRPTVDFTGISTSETKAYITGTTSADIDTAYLNVCVPNNQVKLAKKICQ